METEDSSQSIRGLIRTPAEKSEELLKEAVDNRLIAITASFDTLRTEYSESKMQELLVLIRDYLNFFAVLSYKPSDHTLAVKPRRPLEIKMIDKMIREIKDLYLQNGETNYKELLIKLGIVVQKCIDLFSTKFYEHTA